eukprot:4328878-Prymnesium_polylepis.1
MAVHPSGRHVQSRLRHREFRFSLRLPRGRRGRAHIGGAVRPAMFNVVVRLYTFARPLNRQHLTLISHQRPVQRCVQSGWALVSTCDDITESVSVWPLCELWEAFVPSFSLHI